MPDLPDGSDRDVAGYLRSRSSHICWAVGGFLTLGTLAYHLTGGTQPLVVGAADVAGVAIGHHLAVRYALGRQQ